MKIHRNGETIELLPAEIKSAYMEYLINFSEEIIKDILSDEADRAYLEFINRDEVDYKDLFEMVVSKHGYNKTTFIKELAHNAAEAIDADEVIYNEACNLIDISSYNQLVELMGE